MTEGVEQYLTALPDDRRALLSAVYEVVRAHLSTGYAEGIQHGMIAWYVPLDRYPDTYNGEPLGLASLANQKRHASLYLMGVYADEYDARWFRERWQATGKRLDMGKSCVRFRRLDDVPLEVIGEAIARTPVDALIASYERARGDR